MLQLSTGLDEKRERFANLSSIASQHICVCWNETWDDETSNKLATNCTNANLHFITYAVIINNHRGERSLLSNAMLYIYLFIIVNWSSSSNLIWLSGLTKTRYFTYTVSTDWRLGWTWLHFMEETSFLPYLLRMQ